MTIYVSVVSHGNEALISRNNQLQALATLEGGEVVLRDNLGCAELRAFASDYSMHYLASPSPMGFGANNNAVFEYCRSTLGMQPGDYFCLHNPDLVITPDVLLEAVNAAELCAARLVTINLFQDRELSRPDFNIKRFPSLLDFARGFLLGSNPAAYDKAAIDEPTLVDWASGAFLLFKAELYQQLNGFDERFFMYLEDVDICRRSRDEFGDQVLYLPHLKAVHLCQQANKRLFSRHFYWFMVSMLKYFLRSGSRKLGLRT
ncbi:glycosyltransferase family 2 protein [Marinobacterium rhizophilum]|uniref:Glycosyltransferase family 2 protein n=1 Tax=Marinobacterium rhizophilum TaxID=420402 RepID=A0ABY5HP92_9GAMM|nr:glycosyltransferase family 2 protein [Marinobacterium rhizophilum]UTW14251.1 glycosyltransferase family 2 protein [Marinobacterium rhizophilum]